MSGHRTFPRGEFALQDHHVALWSEAMATPPAHGVSPSIALLLCFRGAGMSISGIIAELDTTPRDVLFGEISIDLDGAFRPGRTYSIETEITGIERKHGRSIGAFDKVTLRYTLFDGACRAAIVTQTWIVSRD